MPVKPRQMEGKRAQIPFESMAIKEASGSREPGSVTMDDICQFEGTGMDARVACCEGARGAIGQSRRA